LDDNDFWLALASTQHRLGHVATGTIERALQILDDPEELARWDPKARMRRRVALDKLRAQLTEPVPQPKKVRPRKKVDTALEPGEHVVFDSGSVPALLRITGVTSDRGGRYARAVHVEWDGTERQLREAHRLPPVLERGADRLRREPEARGFTLIGEPADPAGLKKLPSAVDRRTPTMRWQSLRVLRWSQLAKFLEEQRGR